MAESHSQRDYLVYAVDVLQQHFRPWQDVYVSGKLLLYYDEDDLARRWRRTCSWGLEHPTTGVLRTCCGASRRHRTSCWR